MLHATGSISTMAENQNESLAERTPDRMEPYENKDANPREDSCSETTATGMYTGTIATSSNVLAVPLLPEPEPQSVSANSRRRRRYPAEEEIRRRMAETTATTSTCAGVGATWLRVGAFIPLLSGLFLIYVVGNPNLEDPLLPLEDVLYANVFGLLLFFLAGGMFSFANFLETPAEVTLQPTSSLPLPPSVTRYLPVQSSTATITYADDDGVYRVAHEDEAATSDDEEEELQRIINASLEDSRRYLAGRRQAAAVADETLTDVPTGAE
jgi:hypothetical protein